MKKNVLLIGMLFSILFSFSLHSEISKKSRENLCTLHLVNMAIEIILHEIGSISEMDEAEKLTKQKLISKRKKKFILYIDAVLWNEAEQIQNVLCLQEFSFDETNMCKKIKTIITENIHTLSKNQNRDRYILNLWLCGVAIIEVFQGVFQEALTKSCNALGEIFNSKFSIIDASVLDIEDIATNFESYKQGCSDRMQAFTNKKDTLGLYGCFLRPNKRQKKKFFELLVAMAQCYDLQRVIFEQNLLAQLRNVCTKKRSLSFLKYVKKKYRRERLKDVQKKSDEKGLKVWLKNFFERIDDCCNDIKYVDGPF